MNPLATIRDRKIGQWTFGYVALAWGALQLLDFLANHFGWPAWVVRASTVFLIVNTLAVVILAWYHGERGRQRATTTEIALLALILVFATGGAWSAGRRTPVAVGTTPNHNGVDATSVETPASENSIAVLPFVNIGAAAQEYFSDGITEEILNAIAKVPGLQIAARTSSFAFKGKTEDISLIARKLRVAHIVEGSVQHEGSRIRVTAQLITASSGYHMWSGKYDRDAKDLFAVEDEISRAIAKELQSRIGASTVLASRATASETAHELYLLGLDSWSRRSMESVHKAVDYFTHAIAADSSYADAHAGLALALAVLPRYDPAAPIAQTFARGKAEAKRALELDPKSASAYAALGQIAEYEDHMQLGEQYERKALLLNPNYATAHQWLAEAMWMQGRIPEATVEINRALALDPLSPIMLAVRGNIRRVVADPTAMNDERAALALNPHFQTAIGNLANMALAAHQYDVARPLLPALLAPSKREFMTDTIIDGLRTPQGRPALVRFLHGPPIVGSNFFPFLAELAGDRELAIQLARAAEKRGDFPLLYWGHMSAPQMKGLGTDPRFPARFAWPRTRP